MKTVINRYKKFVFIYVSINLFALLVNIFNINSYSTFGTAEDSTNIHYFTNHYHDADQLWPFVSYVTTQPSGYTYSYSAFEGIFYKYGIAEFILYIGILIGFLTYRAYISNPAKKVPSV